MTWWAPSPWYSQVWWLFLTSSLDSALWLLMYLWKSRRSMLENSCRLRTPVQEAGEEGPTVTAHPPPLGQTNLVPSSWSYLVPGLSGKSQRGWVFWDSTVFRPHEGKKPNSYKSRAEQGLYIAGPQAGKHQVP